MTPGPLFEDALRRIAALEAAVLTHTPTARASDTPVWPRRDPDRAPRPAPADPPAGPDPLAVLASLDDAVWSVSPDGQQVLFAAGAVERLYGRTAAELRAAPGRWLDAVHPDDRARFRAALAKLPDTGTFALEHRVRHAAGGTRWALTRGALVRDPDGRPARVDGSATDVTHPRRTGGGLRDVLEALGAATGAAFLADLVEALCGACGCRAAVAAEWHPDDPRAARTAALWLDGRAAAPFAFPAGGGLVRDLLAGGRAFVPHGARDRFPADPLLDRLRAEALAAEPLCDHTGRLLGFLAVADDRPFAHPADARALLKALAPRAAVELARAREPAGARAAAERRAAEAEAVLASAADLAAAGRAAAGLAHDFNNLLSVACGFAELVRDALPVEHPRHDAARTAAAAAHKAAGLSRQLLALGRAAPERPVPLHPGTALRALEPVLRGALGRKVELALDVAADLPPIAADPVRFDRVVLNLILNARDATESGTVGVRVAAADGFVALTVTDTGTGMPPEVRAQMFDSYFTTKGDRGTGLGLATVRDAVRAAGGRVEVESEQGWGTQVRVYWPALAPG